MIIEGEKWACDACVRGHRVSNCQHSDRPLQHINKKGRPVSQCQHCRAMRKSRSAHIKCDCGEKSSKCAHLQQTLDGHTDTCCCNHGGRCTCSHKKESPLDTVPESDSEGELPAAANAARAKAIARRRRANTIHSDAGLSFDQNGHHKPSAKFNRATQKAGPYQLNRVNSANSASSLGASVESLTTNGRSRASSNREPRRVKSEAASPLISSSSFTQLSGNLPPLDLSSIDYPSYVANSTPELFNSGFSDLDAPIYSAGLSAASVDWSHYDLADVKGEGFAPSSYSQTGAQSYNGMFDFGSGSEQLPNLANTTSTSGDVSEVEDFMAGGEGDFDGLGSNSFFRQSNMLNSADLSSIDYDNFASDAFAKGNDSGSVVGGSVSMVEDDPAFWVSDYANENTLNALEDNSDPMASNTMGSFWES